MSLFFESIRVVNGRVMNLAAHQRRVDRCVLRYHKTDTLDLKTSINKQKLPSKGVMKLRIQYNPKTLECTEIKYEHYKEKEIRTLALIHDNDLDYNYKSEDRKQLDRAFAQRLGADDIILVRDGLLTDTWYCNIALFDGVDWWTPQFPLLKGTMREKLLAKKIIKEKNILFSEINTYQKIRLFNAMIPWGNKKDINLDDSVELK